MAVQLIIMMIKKNKSAFHGNSANMQGEDEPQKTKAKYVASG
jgi:hypothetical protein